MSGKARIVVINQHGFNRGDEAAFRGLVHGISGFLGYRPHFQVISRGYLDLSGLQDVKQDFRPGVFSRRLLFGHTLQWGKERCWYIAQLGEADLIIYGPGGPSLGDYYSGEWGYLLSMRWAIRSGAPFMIYAPSCGPFHKKGRNAFRRLLLNRTGTITSRDPISKAYMEELGINHVEQSADSAFQLYHQVAQPVNEPENYVVVTPIDLSWHPIHHTHAADLREKLLKALAPILQDIIAGGTKIVFLPQLYRLDVQGNLTMDPNEEALIKSFTAVLQPSSMVNIFDVNNNVEEQIRAVARARMLIGCRYHSLVFAAITHVPFIGITYEHKAEGLLQLLEAEEYGIRIDKVGYEELSNLSYKVITNYHRIKEHLAVRVPLLVEKAAISSVRAVSYLR